MIINTARFATSSPSVSRCPDSKVHEYAFIGRSNVGKSSLINMLTGRSSLAKTSATPGKTMLINHFDINGQWYIVDLPGYGYARRSKDDRGALDKMIRGYILNRRQMTNLFLLIDGRHAPQRIDMEFIEWLGDNGVPFSIVFTKLDKMGPVAARKHVADYCAALLEQWEELPPVFLTSSVDRRGRDEILDYIEQLNQLSAPTDDANQDEPNVVLQTNNSNDTDMETKVDSEAKERQKAQTMYPGVSVDRADCDKTTDKMVKNDVTELNNNPRSTEGPLDTELN